MKAPPLTRPFVVWVVCILAATASADSSVELLMMHYIHSYEPAVFLPDGRVFLPDQAGSDIYDAQVDTFKTASASAICRPTDCAATLLPDGTVFVAGASAAEVFDPVSNSFTSLGSLVCRNRHTATVTLLPNGRVLVAGGCKDLRAEVYDPSSRTSSFTGAMMSYRSDSVATLLGDGRVLITGGRTYDGKVLSTCEIYDFKSGAFVSAPSMNSKRYGHTATLLADGRVLVTSRLPDEKGPSAELYDLKTGNFVPTGQMIYGRTGHTASILANGDVLLAGGLGWGLHNLIGSSTIEDQNSVELYHPATGRFSRGAPMRVRRSGHSAALLPTGRLLIAGGVHKRWYRLEERYEPTAESYDTRTRGSQRIVRALFAWRSNSEAGSRWVLVSGSGFMPGDTLLVDGLVQTTTYISSALLSAPFSEYQSAGNIGVHEVRVRYSDSGQSLVSEPAQLQAANSPR